MLRTTQWSIVCSGITIFSCYAAQQDSSDLLPSSAIVTNVEKGFFLTEKFIVSLSDGSCVYASHENDGTKHTYKAGRGVGNRVDEHTNPQRQFELMKKALQEREKARKEELLKQEPWYQWLRDSLVKPEEMGAIKRIIKDKYFSPKKRGDVHYRVMHTIDDSDQGRKETYQQRFKSWKNTYYIPITRGEFTRGSQAQGSSHSREERYRVALLAGLAGGWCLTTCTTIGGQQQEFNSGRNGRRSPTEAQDEATFRLIKTVYEQRALTQAPGAMRPQESKKD